MNIRNENASQLQGIGTLLKEDQVAEILSVSRACLRKWRVQGRGPTFVRLAGGSAVRYPQQGLLMWVQKQPAGGGDEQVGERGIA